MERIAPSAPTATRVEAGNNEFIFFKVNGFQMNGEHIVLERWHDQAMLDRHIEQPCMKAVPTLFADRMALPLSELPEHGNFLDDVSVDATQWREDLS